MYFERTEIQNFKGVEKMKLEFSPGVNLLIGNNGVGKTTVLEALALSMQNYFNRMNGITKKRMMSILPATWLVMLHSIGCIPIQRL